MEAEDFSEEINNEIEIIKKKVISGEKSLLEIELVPLFVNLKKNLNVDNLDKSSSTYNRIFHLLAQKFEELKLLLSSLDQTQIFLDYLKTNPGDLEICQFLEGCWRKPFTIDTISLDFLESSKNKLTREKGETLTLELVNKIDIKEDFLLEIPTKKFTDKMMEFFNSIKDKLPCSYEDVFKDEKTQSKLFENFVYLLHLLQLNKIKYEKNTNMLYL